MILVLVHVPGATGSFDRLNVRYDSGGYQYQATGTMTYQLGGPC